MLRLRDIASFMSPCFSLLVVGVCLVGYVRWRDHWRRMSNKELRKDGVGIVFAKTTIKNQLVKHHCDFLNNDFVKFFYALLVNLGSIGCYCIFLYCYIFDFSHCNHFLSYDCQDISVVLASTFWGVISAQLA